MGKMDEIFGFFTGDNKRAANEVPTDAWAFINEQLSDHRLKTTLQTVRRVVLSKDWLFHAGAHFSYENDSLAQAIHAGEDVLSLTEYMNGEAAYRGVELNEDVLKTVLTHFLNTIEVYEYDAFSFSLEEVLDRVQETPTDLLKYVIEERQTKLDQIFEEIETMPERATEELARRIFEYDLLLQAQGAKAMGDHNRVNSYARRYADAVYQKAIARIEAEDVPEASEVTIPMEEGFPPVNNEETEWAAPTQDEGEGSSFSEERRM